MKKIDKIREAKKLSMRRAREKLKNDPEKYEEQKQKDKERKRKTRKNISDMSEREKRAIRKGWKERTKKSHENKKNIAKTLQNVTPPPSPQINLLPASPDPEEALELPGPSRPSSRSDSGEKRRRRNRQILKKQLQNLKDENIKLRKNATKYKQKYYRLQATKEDTPRKLVKKMLTGQKCSQQVRKQLTFNEVLKKQINLNYCTEKGLKKKREFVKVITGKIVKKYRLMNSLHSLTSRKIMNFHKSGDRTRLIENEKVKRAVKDFFERDSSSRLTAGKKETITRNKQKKQKRLLNDTLKNLYKEFINAFPCYRNTSYATFCKLRPFWVVKPDYKARDTCLCMEHANFSLVLDKLNMLKIIDEKNPTELLKKLTCEGKLKETCLERVCTECANNDIAVNEYEDEDVTCYQWKMKKVEIKVKGKMKLCQKTTKEEITYSKNELLCKFKSSMIGKFMQHVCNIKHQYSVTTDIKENLSANDILIHCDFSENYNCKYSQEVQSLHFGGSRNQVSLHTTIVYYHSETEKSTKCKSFCTLSEDRRHDYVAICSHLKPVIDDIKTNVQLMPLKNVHFLSDGTSQQYRNKNMFYLAATFFQQELQPETICWHYMEKGHGKGAPDGIGGCVKRTADSLVSQGKDLADIDTLVKELKEKCKGITIYKIDSENFTKYDDYVPKKLRTFKGTLKIHEVSWSKKIKKEVHARRLSCIKCAAGENCPHYGIGKIEIPKDSTNDLQDCILLNVININCYISQVKHIFITKLTLQNNLTHTLYSARKHLAQLLTNNTLNLYLMLLYIKNCYFFLCIYRISLT